MKICTKWSNLPYDIRRHLQERLLCRKITPGDLDKLRIWIESLPDVPAGLWFKDFGSFKIGGRDQYPLTFLTNEQVAYGTEIQPEKDDD